jgi:hypothetical protein
MRTLEERARDALGRPEQRRRNVFISYSYDDGATVNALRAQAANELTDLAFNDRSLRVPFDSENAEYIRRGLRERIRNCSVTFVYLSDHSAHSRWVDWEVRESLRQGKKVVGLYSGDRAPIALPRSFTENGLTVVRWSHENLTRELG